MGSRQGTRSLSGFGLGGAGGGLGVCNRDLEGASACNRPLPFIALQLPAIATQCTPCDPWPGPGDLAQTGQGSAPDCQEIAPAAPLRQQHTHTRTVTLAMKLPAAAPNASQSSALRPFSSI